MSVNVKLSLCIMFAVDVVWFICRDLEQVAMDRLVELAYKKQLVTFVCVFFIIVSFFKV
jgi:hypothetical protein